MILELFSKKRCLRGDDFKRYFLDGLILHILSGYLCFVYVI